MMVDFEFRTDLPAFSAELKALGAKLEKQAVRKAGSAAARVMRDEAKRTAPVLSASAPIAPKRVRGALKKNVRFARSRYQVAGAYRLYVGVRSGKKVKGDPYYWKFLEGGWVPSGRRKRQGGDRYKALTRKRDADARASSGRSRSIKFPFLAPAYFAKRQDAVLRFNQVIAEFISKQKGGRA